MLFSSLPLFLLLLFFMGVAALTWFSVGSPLRVRSLKARKPESPESLDPPTPNSILWLEHDIFDIETCLGPLKNHVAPPFILWEVSGSWSTIL